MTTQRCWKCGKQFQVLDDEVGDHGCQNPLCGDFEKLEFEDDEDESIN